MSSNYIDISGWQPENINWALYKQWSAAGDGVSRVCIKANEGTAGMDAVCLAHWKNALAAGIDEIILYHFARPDLNPNWEGAAASARAFLAAVGSGLRAHDKLMLDMEQTPLQDGWVHDLAAELTALVPTLTPDRIAIYASLAYVGEHLQDTRLATYPLILADWTFDPNARPACPKPWSSYMALQYSDRLSGVPGVPEAVDANVFLKEPTPPAPPPVDTAAIGAALDAIEAQIADIRKLLV